MKLMKRIAALGCCTLMMCCMVKSVSPKPAQAGEKLLVGQWTLTNTVVTYAGPNRYHDRESQVILNEETVTYKTARESPYEQSYYVKDRVCGAGHVGNNQPFWAGWDANMSLGKNANLEEYEQQDIYWGDPPASISVYSTNGADAKEIDDIELSDLSMRMDWNMTYFVYDHQYRAIYDWDEKKQVQKWKYKREKFTKEDTRYELGEGNLEVTWSTVEKGTILDRTYEEEYESFYEENFGFPIDIYHEKEGFDPANPEKYVFTSSTVFYSDEPRPKDKKHFSLNLSNLLKWGLSDPFRQSNTKNLYTGENRKYVNDKSLVVWIHAALMDAEVVQAYVYDYTPIIEGGCKVDNGQEGASQIAQNEFVQADEKPGEDGGTFILSDIIDGIDKEDVALGAGAAAAALGAAGLAAAGKGGSKDGGKDDKKKKKQSAYKMYIKKDFGDTLDKLNKQIICARIVEVNEQGAEKTRGDLTEKIEIFAGANTVVTPIGMKDGIYKAAEIIAAEESTDKEGTVCFRYEGEGGTFTETVVFKLANPQVVFGQENLGLPAHYENTVEVWFGVTGIIQPEITASFDGKNCPYSVEVVPDGEVQGLYCARITDKDQKDKGNPGNTKTYHLRIVAKKDKARAEGVFDVSRIFMGLTFTLEADALGCYLKTRDGAPLRTTSDDLVPCVTKGRLSLLYWNDEEQVIEKIAIRPQKKVKVQAYRVDNDTNSLVGEPLEKHQTMAEQLGICIFPMDSIDTDGSRIVQITCTQAGLDAPTRLRAEITVSAVYKGETYEASRRILLHSLPFRNSADDYTYCQTLDQDDILTDKLANIKSQIFSKYMKNLFSLYYFIDRMMIGYDPNFGYDPGQVQRVYYIWIRFVRGKFVGANAQAEKVTLADELNACYAFLQGMRDNGGFLGRIALGICTAGYSETLFFAMDLAEKMEDTIVRQGKDLNFWDGVVMGVKEYEKQVAMELLMAGGLKLANYAGGKMLGKLTGHPEGIDIGKTITQKYRSAMDAADQSLKAKSGTYRSVSGTLEKIGVFSSTGAGAAKDVLDKDAAADAEAKLKAETTIAQRRMGNPGVDCDPIHDGAMAEGMEKVRRFYDLIQQHGTARQAGTLPEIEAEIEVAWLEVKTDKNAFKALKAMNDPMAQTVRAEFSRIRKMHRSVVLDRVLDDVAQTTGKNREDLYFQSVTSNEAWKEDAGLTLPEDLDLTIRERCHSEENMDLDVVIDQSVGEDSVARQLYKEFHGGEEPPSIEAAREFAEDMDVTYVSPWGDQGNQYEIEFNFEAFPELDPLFQKEHLGDELKAQAMDRQTIMHKGEHWYERGKKLEAEAAGLEADAALLTGAERDALIQQATKLRYKADGCYVEGVRQITKSARGIVEPRAQMHAIKTGGDNPFTAKAREMTAAGEMVQEGMAPSQFFDYLESEHGTDFNGFASEIAGCLE